MQSEANERGYLNEHFRLFHTTDLQPLQVDWHFHTFDKLVFFRSGQVEYSVESETYALRPGDLLLISHGQLHRMRAKGGAAYERFILYLDGAYLHNLAPQAGGLNACFRQARQSGHSLLRLGDSERASLYQLFSRLEKALTAPSAYADVLSQAILIELMVQLCSTDIAANFVAVPAQGDDKIAQALTYIQANLGENLSCSILAERLYMSRSSFQHRFREATGYTPHAYIRLKRLLYASELLAGGESATNASRKCGYGDYSAFCHAFKEQFGVSPAAFLPRGGLNGPDE